MIEYASNPSGLERSDKIKDQCYPCHQW